MALGSRLGGRELQLAAPSQFVGVQRSQLARRLAAPRQTQQRQALALTVSQPSSYGEEGSSQQQQPQQPAAADPEQLGGSKQPDKEKPLVRVQLSVHYRVHSRQMLCVGGSQIPFGWSFLSIAKVPMTWNQGDVWTCELMLPAGQRVEYKYVILEEQDWTKLENEDSEGLVEVSYRSGSEPGRPPDIQVIQKQMAIVAWQPGPNRVVIVPTEAELTRIMSGEIVERVPARPGSRFEAEQQQRRPNPYEGTWEILSLDEQGQPFLDRHDVWGWNPGSGRPAGMRGFRFDS